MSWHRGGLKPLASDRKAKAMAEADLYHIYRYDFDDGSAYVGRTKQSLAARHSSHRNRPVNRYLWHQLRRYPDTKPELIGSYTTLTEAVAAERQALAALDKPLNAVWISTERFVPEGCNGRLADNSPIAYALLGRTRNGEVKIRDRRYPRVQTGSYRCRTCYQHKPPEAYCTETGRSSGIASRCRECNKHVRRMYRLYKHAGRPQWQAYQDCVAAIRDGTIAEAIAEAMAAAEAAGSSYKRRGYRPRIDRRGDNGSVLCMACGDYKQRSEFYHRLGSSVGLAPHCKTCHAVINKATREAKRDGRCTSEAWQAAKAALAASTS